MRIFWVLVGLLVVCVGAWLALAGTGAARARERAAAERAAAEQARAAAETVRAGAGELAAASAPEGSKAGPAPGELANASRTDRSVPAGAKPIVVEPAPAATTSPTPGRAEAAKSDAGGAATNAGGRTLGGYAVDEARVEVRDDGTTLVDGVLALKGRGTAESPYEITWDMLTAAEATLDPRAGKKRIPAIAGFLHEKHVRLRGYVSFPLMIKEPRECLAMLNQWDGCCIGVPPTPYDAVEVALKKPANGNARYATAGSVTGVLQVKPYVMGDWLVGLYVMTQGELDATDFGGPAGS